VWIVTFAGESRPDVGPSMVLDLPPVVTGVVIHDQTRVLGAFGVSRPVRYVMARFRWAACLLLAASSVLSCGGLLGTPPPPSPEGVVRVMNLDGPTTVVIIDGVELAQLSCGEVSAELTPGRSGLPPFPWHVDLFTLPRVPFASVDVTSPGRVLIRRDGAYFWTFGSAGPAPLPCPT
jgi:hypothetical protein